MASCALMPMPLSAMVSDLGIPVEGHAHFPGWAHLRTDAGLIQRLETQLVAGVRGVGDQLVHEDFG